MTKDDAQHEAARLNRRHGPGYRAIRCNERWAVVFAPRRRRKLRHNRR